MTLHESNNSLPNREGGGRVSLWLCLCAGDILLRREGADGAFSLPIGDEAPVPLKPWNIVTEISFTPPSLTGGVGGGSAKIVRLDRPVVGIDGLEMMGLRASFQVLSADEYAIASKAAELIYWDANTKYCGCCGSPTKWMTDISTRTGRATKPWTS